MLLVDARLQGEEVAVGAQRIQDTANGEDVGFGPGALAQPNLGSDIARCAVSGLNKVIGFERESKSKVANPDPGVLGDKDVQVSD